MGKPLKKVEKKIKKIGHKTEKHVIRPVVHGAEKVVHKVEKKVVRPIVHIPGNLSKAAKEISDTTKSIRQDVLPDLKGVVSNMQEITESIKENKNIIINDVKDIVRDTKEFSANLNEGGKSVKKIFESETSAKVVKVIGILGSVGAAIGAVEAIGHYGVSAYKGAANFYSWWFTKLETRKEEYAKILGELQKYQSVFQRKINILNTSSDESEASENVLENSLKKASELIGKLNSDIFSRNFTPDIIGKTIYILTEIINHYQEINEFLPDYDLGAYRPEKIEEIKIWLETNEKLLPERIKQQCRNVPNWLSAQETEDTQKIEKDLENSWFYFKLR